MANVKITALTNLASGDVDAEDVFIIDDISATESKKITFANLRAAVDTIATSNINTVSSNVTAVEARRAANVVIFINEDTALQARLTTNVTAFTNEDTALQARITANNTLSHSNDFITFTRLNANIDLVQDNVASVTVGTAADSETRLNANLNVVQDNVTAVQSRLATNVSAFTNEDTALQSRLTTNVTAFTNEDTALQARITANNTLSHSNDFITFTRLNANLDVVQDNVASITTGSTAFTGEVTMNDDLVVTGNLTVNGTTTTINTTNLDVDDTMIMLANGTTGSPANDIGILFNRGNQGNAAIFYDESAKTFKFSDTKDPKSNTSLSPVSASNISVGILDAATVKFNGADLNTAITDNVSTLNTTDTALQARITANNTLITELETRRTQNIAGGVSTITTSDLTADRALISSGSGKVAVSAITATELGHLDGMTQNINSNLAALAAGIAASGSASFPTGDYGLLDTANSSTDSFGVAVAGLTTFDMKTEPAGSLSTEDLGALT